MSSPAQSQSPWSASPPQPAAASSPSSGSLPSPSTEESFSLQLAEANTISDPNYYQEQWAALPIAQSFEWDLKYKLTDDAQAAACKTDSIEGLLAKSNLFTMASGNVQGQLKLYLSATATKIPTGVDPFVFLSTNPPPSLFLVELLIILKTGKIFATLKCASPSERDAMLPYLRKAIAPLVKQ